MALTWPYDIVRKALSPTAHQRKKYERYMTYEVQMAPSVPLGMAVLGSEREEARLAPERIPVKHGKKSFTGLGVGSGGGVGLGLGT